MSRTTLINTVNRGMAAVLIGLLPFTDRSSADTKTVTALHIGTTETFIEENVPEGSDDTAVEDTSRQFIQAVTGLGSDFVALENHEVLAERLARGELNLGFFMGYEFAWAQARHPKLKVLVTSVNYDSYLYPALVVRKGGPIRKLADLKGTTLALPRAGQGYGRLFIAAQSRLAGQEPAAFLGHVDSFEDAETPLDDVVDQTRQAAVVDRLALEAYQRRKPGRFARLTKLSESAPMPPAVFAYYDGNLDPQTVTRLRNELSNAHNQINGEQLLTLLRLTRFAPPSSDFDRVLAETRTTYPAPALVRTMEAHAEADAEKQPRFASDFLPSPYHLPQTGGEGRVRAGFAAVSGADKGFRQGEPEYYLSVFAFDSVPRRAQFSHTFATFIKSSGGSAEAHTISWLPRGQHIEIARTQAEPGINLDLNQTLRFARDVSARVYEWGPYRIRPELYERSLRQIERLNSGHIQYKALDGAWRPDAASNCIHAVSDIDAGDGYLTVGGAYGVAASARVVEHLRRWMIQPGQEDPSTREKLGLSGQPVTRVADNGEVAAAAR
jgi:ABC-type phosphate/phosphonate transport system substrate-binding protein